MTQLDLIIALAERDGLTKENAARIVKTFFNSMTDALEKGDRIEVRGLCSFDIKKYPAHMGKNPKTGEPVQVPAKKFPFFKCGKELKNRVDYPQD